MPVSDTLIVVLGISVVFIGLICIVILCKIMSAVCSMAESKKEDADIIQSAPAMTSAAPQPIENKQEIIAAVSAAVAEELGTDISAIRILSFKKI